MGYNEKAWKKRIHSRSDLSTYLTHFTRGTNETKPIDVLIKILKEGTINGSEGSGFIVGNEKAVCFQDAPLYGLCQNLLHEELHRKELGGKIRYLAYGLAFSKRHMFTKGARPVFYENTELAKSILPPEEHYRIVKMDLTDSKNIIDWTHEREWRIKGDFQFELKDVTVYVGTNKAYKHLLSNLSLDTLKKINGIVLLQPVIF